MKDYIKAIYSAYDWRAADHAACMALLNESFCEGDWADLQTAGDAMQLWSWRKPHVLSQMRYQGAHLPDYVDWTVWPQERLSATESAWAHRALIPLYAAGPDDIEEVYAALCAPRSHGGDTPVRTHILRVAKQYRDAYVGWLAQRPVCPDGSPLARNTGKVQ